MKNNRKQGSRHYSKLVKGGDTTSDSKYEPVQAQYLEVKVYDNFDRALRAFRALVQKERILSIYKDRQAYEKPSDKKRRKRNEMKRKAFELSHKRDESFDKTKKRKFKYSEDTNG